MKNKSKLKKIKQKKQVQQATVPAEWLYMNDAVIDFEAIKEAFSGEERVNVQIWEEAGVAELEIADAKSIDLERSKVDLGDEYSNAFLAEHQVQTLFLVTISPGDFTNSKPVMEFMVQKLGGFFCGDTEDFTPVIKVRSNP